MPSTPRSSPSKRAEGRALATWLLVCERVTGDFSPHERRALIHRAITALDTHAEAKRSPDVAREARKLLAGMLRT